MKTTQADEKIGHEVHFCKKKELAVHSCGMSGLYGRVTELVIRAELLQIS